MRMDYENLKEEDLLEEVKDVHIDKDAFKGSLKCIECGKDMKKVKSRMDLPSIDITVHFEVWRCSKCNRESLDGEQAKKLDRILDV